MTWSGTFNTWPQMGEAGYQGGDGHLTFFFLFLPTEPCATSDIGAVSNTRVLLSLVSAVVVGDPKNRWYWVCVRTITYCTIISTPFSLIEVLSSVLSIRIPE